MSDHTDTTLTDTERAQIADSMPFPTTNNEWATLIRNVESIVAARLAAARAEQDALWRERLTELPDQMSGAWGGGAPWLTTGDKVATLVGDWLRALIEGADQ